MKSFLISIICIASSLSLFSQELVVKSFQLNEGDLSARTEKRLDSNGNQCALIKVEAIPACEFGGYVIGSVEKKLGAYWVYVCAQNPTARKLIIYSDNFQPLEVEFSTFGITRIEAGVTYTLRIESINRTGINIIGGHKYIDMGLSVHWADCNLGALKPHEKGDKYAWGVNFSTKDTIDVKNICGTKYDAVSQLWGGEWRMPTADELSELTSKCIIYDDKENNVLGKRCIGPSGNSIFIPYTKKIEAKDSVIEYETSIWSGNKCVRRIRIKNHYVPFYISMSSSGIEDLFATGSIKNERYCRPVINNMKYNVNYQNWGSPNNNRYLIKGQLVESLSNMPINTPINIYDNTTGKLVQQVVNEKGLFEIWVEKDQELRFEFADGSDSKPIIKKVNPIMIVRMMHAPTFGLG